MTYVVLFVFVSSYLNSEAHGSEVMRFDTMAHCQTASESFTWLTHDRNIVYTCVGGVLTK